MSLTVQNIIKDLKHSKLTQVEIADKNNCSQSYVSYVNKEYNCRDEEKKIVYEHNYIKERNAKIYNLLMSSNMTVKEIAKECLCSVGTVYPIKRQYLKENNL